MTPISDPFEVIAAFIDGERVDPAALASALSRPEGRDYLVEMAALREVVASDTTHGIAAPPRSRAPWFVAAAAAVVISLAGGYALGHRTSGAPPANARVDGPTLDVPAPAPTRVIEVAPGDSHVGKGGL